MKEKKNFKCIVCYASFSHKATIKKHVSSAHERKMPFKFNDCGTRYPQKGFQQLLASSNGK